MKKFKEIGEMQDVIIREYDGDKQPSKLRAVPFANRLDYFDRKNKILTNLERSRVTDAIPHH